MNAASKMHGVVEGSTGSDEAVYFSSAGRTLFGFYHPTGSSTSDSGLVICKPFGYEATCSHRSIRVFAETAAAIGVPALRFDYLGTGDSGDIEPQADQIETWTTDVIAATLELQKLAGVRRVCLVGIRLGALLAVTAASRCPLINSLVLIAPVLTGRRYLNELHASRLASSTRVRPNNAKIPAAEISEGIRSDSMEFSGFSMSAQTRKTLMQTDLALLKALPVQHLLVMDFINRGAAREWTQSLASTVTQTKYFAVPGLNEMLMWAPMHAMVPTTVVTSLTAWLRQSTSRQLTQEKETVVPAGLTVSLKPPKGNNVLRLILSDETSRYIERPVLLSSKSVLFGVVTEPLSWEARKHAVLFLGAGADYHIGPNGMHVTMARHWASSGCVALRLDLGGIGDSATEPGKQSDTVFTSSAIDDIGVAIRFLREQYQMDDVAIVGVCSGAYHALRAAVAGLPVTRIFMINPTNYFWHPDMDIRGLQLADVVHETGIYRERLFSRRAWRKLLTGELNVARIARVYARRFFLAIETIVRSVARRFNFKLSKDLRYDLEALDRRRVTPVFIFARSEPGLTLLSLQTGLSIAQLTSRYRIHIIDGGDHIFSHKASRAVMEQILRDELIEGH
jgi:pimeloyl-ACP methyl ester carboxylesterase